LRENALGGVPRRRAEIGMLPRTAC
jgi:hypothetical protein